MDAKFKIDIMKITTADTYMISCVLADNRYTSNLIPYKTVQLRPVIWIGRRHHLLKQIFLNKNINFIIQGELDNLKRDYFSVLCQTFAIGGDVRGQKMMSLIEKFITDSLKDVYLKRSDLPGRKHS